MRATRIYPPVLLCYEFRMSDEIRQKSVTFQVKQDDDERTVTARFATLGVVDHDGDIIEAGAIGEQDVFMSAWGHDHWSLPPGSGVTSEDDDAAIFKGRFFDTTTGRDHYETIKQAGGQQEWSFGFRVLDGALETHDGDDVYIIRKTEIFEVSPVMRGAGINTGTVDIKDCDGQCQARRAGQTPEVDSASVEQIAETVAEKVAASVAPAVATAVLDTMVNLGIFDDESSEPEPEPKAADAKVADPAPVDQDLGDPVAADPVPAEPKAATADAPVADVEPDGAKDPDPDTKTDLDRQVEAILAGFSGLPENADPAIAAFERYQRTVLEE